MILSRTKRVKRGVAELEWPGPCRLARVHIDTNIKLYVSSKTFREPSHSQVAVQSINPCRLYMHPILIGNEPRWTIYGDLGYEA